MRFVQFFVVAIVFVAVTHAGAVPADDKKTVANLDTEYQTAVKANDAATMDRILADDFILVDGDGTVSTKADLLKEARSRRIAYEHQEEIEQTVRLWGDTAVVTARLWGKGTDSGKPFEWMLWFSDMYVRTPKGWRYAFGQASLPLPQTSSHHVNVPVVPARPEGVGTPLASAPSDHGQPLTKSNDKVAVEATVRDRSATSDQRTAQRLSSQQEEVWKREQDSFRYLNVKDLRAFMSMWDANFVGWPDYNDRPVRKADIESSAVEEFRSSQTPGQPLPAPQPEAVAVFGDVAVTHYFWPEADETSPTIYRITHAWQKGRGGWHIIGGMSCPVPRSAEAISGATGSGQSSKSQVATATVPPEPDSPSTPAPQSIGAKILELDRAWGQAYVKGDIDVIDRTLAPDWRGWLDTEGSDKATELAEFKAGKSRSLENIIDNPHVRVYDNTAVVEARERVRFRDETGEHWLTWHITDVFVNQGGQWQVVASHGSTMPNP